MSQKPKAVLFLGSGATAGSGIKKNEHDLPTDGKFFESRLVVDLLKKGGYPALQKAREKKGAREKNLLRCKSLYDTWDALFLFRSFARSGVIQEPWKEQDLLELKDKVNGDNYPGQKEHYKRQFEIWNSQESSTQEKENVSSKLAELAIWDLRVLVKEVYDLDPQHSKYEAFWAKLRESVKIVAVVNLNWDTTFDDWYNSKTDKRSIPIIRPHGSLKWTSSNRWQLGTGWFCRWCSQERETKLKYLGYRGKGDIFDFNQPLIVTHHLKPHFSEHSPR